MLSTPKNRLLFRAKSFWNERQSRAKSGELTGYLLEDSPRSVGRHRFEGEWAQVKLWLEGCVPGRDRCLDLGCGTGEWLKALALEFKQAEGWDYAPAMIAASKRNLKKARIKNTTLRCGQITSRPGKQAFDFIFVGGVLMYTPEDALGPMLKSLSRLLKPSGKLLLRESTFPGGTWLRDSEPLRSGVLASKRQQQALDYVAVYRSAETLKQRLNEAGFKIEASKPNLHYKLSVKTLAWLWRLEGILKGDKQRAARAAAWIYALRYVLIYPELVLRTGKLENQWFLCAKAQRS